MYTLILDSATKVLYCSLVQNEKVIFEKYINGVNDHAKHIVSVIEEACDECGIKAIMLDKVICGVGPGSYTGVRMAVTVSKMFASMSNIKLYSISTLKLMTSGSSNKVLAMIDARRGNVFGAIYKKGKLLYGEKLAAKTEFLQQDYDYIVTEDSFKVDALEVIKNSNYVENPYTIIPNYLRETEAERNLKK